MTSTRSPGRCLMSSGLRVRCRLSGRTSGVQQVGDDLERVALVDTLGLIDIGFERRLSGRTGGVQQVGDDLEGVALVDEELLALGGVVHLLRVLATSV